MSGEHDPLAEGRRLFDAGRFFEAHEVWEELWREAEGARRELLQGLIQVAAACHQLERGRRRQAVTLLERGRRHLEAGRAEDAGLDVPALLEALDALERHIRAGEPSGSAPWPRLVT